jgi:hypothetical protein
MREHFVVPPILSLTSLQPSSASKHPTSIMPNRKKPQPESDALKGWRQIANYLGLPISASPPLGESWMPVTREGLNRLAIPVQIATEDSKQGAIRIHSPC